MKGKYCQILDIDPDRVPRGERWSLVVTCEQDEEVEVAEVRGYGRRAETMSKLQVDLVEAKWLATQLLNVIKTVKGQDPVPAPSEPCTADVLKRIAAELQRIHDAAGGRWEEWGGRALDVGEALEALIESLNRESRT